MILKDETKKIMVMLDEMFNLECKERHKIARKVDLILKKFEIKIRNEVKK